jgi:hypothetical protein
MFMTAIFFFEPFSMSLALSSSAFSFKVAKSSERQTNFGGPKFSNEKIENAEARKGVFTFSAILGMLSNSKIVTRWANQLKKLQQCSPKKGMNKALKSRYKFSLLAPIQSFWPRIFQNFSTDI